MKPFKKILTYAAVVSMPFWPMKESFTPIEKLSKFSLVDLSRSKDQISSDLKVSITQLPTAKDFDESVVTSEDFRLKMKTAVMAANELRNHLLAIKEKRALTKEEEPLLEKLDHIDATVKTGMYDPANPNMFYSTQLNNHSSTDTTLKEVTDEVIGVLNEGGSLLYQSKLTTSNLKEVPVYINAMLGIAFLRGYFSEINKLLPERNYTPIKN